MLSVRSLVKEFGARRAVDGVSFEVEKGTVLGFLGPNGAGKSTTMKAIMGLAPARRGKVTLRGNVVSGMKPHRIARAGLGFVPEDRRIFPELSVWENLDIARRPGVWTETEVFALFPDLAGIRNRRGFIALCLIEIIDSSTRVGFLTLIAFLLIDKGLSTGWATLAVPLILVGGMAGKLACGMLAERVGIIRTIIITEVVTGAGIFAAVALPGVAAALLLPLIGVALQGTSSVLYATIGDLVERERLPRTFGLFYTLGSLCGIAAPLGYGLVGDHLGVSNAIMLMGIAIFLTLPLCAILRPSISAEPIKI